MVLLNERVDSVRSVKAARGVTKERIDSTGGVLVPHGVANERLDSAGSVEVAMELLNSAFSPMAVLKFPVVLL